MASYSKDFFYHPPGEPSLGAVLDLGLKCTHSCKFCYYSFFDSTENQFHALRNGEFRSTSDCLKILSAIAGHGLRHVDVTGGEPTLHPGIVEMAAHAAELGLGFRIITLGQFLLKRKSGKGKNLLDQLLDISTLDFLFSVHAVSEVSFREFTGGSWNRLSMAMRHLQAANIQFGTNTVVFRDNISMLPEIAGQVAQRGAFIHNFIVFNAYHRWGAVPEISRMQPRFQEIYPSLCEAVKILVDAGVAVNIRYAPICVFPGLERHIVGVMGISYDPYEWRNRACNYDRDPEYCAEPIPIGAEGIMVRFGLSFKESKTEGGVDIFAIRGDDGIKVFPEKCKGCAALSVCDGIDPRYADLQGVGELSPIESIETNGPLLKDRTAYKNPHYVKVGTMADMKKIMSSVI